MKLSQLFKFKKPEEEKILRKDVISVVDIIAPSLVEISQGYIKIGERLSRTFFIFSYPRYLSSGWFSPIINLETPMDISFFFHPIDPSLVIKKLVRKITEIEAEIMEREEKGLIRKPELEIAHKDIEDLRDKLQTAQERMFDFGLYITIYGDSEKELRDIETSLRSTLEARLVYIKPALYRQREGFVSTAPYGLDLLGVYTMMNTAPLSSCFPFVSVDLTSNEGVLYGINQHNNSLILFDRFTLENANSVVFGKAGGGKSYAIKLEILRYLMLGVNAIVIDPENEYKPLTEAVGGSFFNISITSPNHVNPFDLPMPREDERPEDVLRASIMNLVGLMRIMLGGLTAEEDAIMDRAITETYAARDITPETDPSTWPERVPLMRDLESVLEGMEGTDSLVRRIRKFTTGTYGPFFNQPSNISLEKNMVTFGIRDMEDDLRPIAMFTIIRYIWNIVRSSLRKRILVVDEAWWMMQTEDGASFLYGIAKRSRKYWLGVTTITQDVPDFMKSEYGQPIVANSSLQLLMRQSPATIDIVQKTFNLTLEEKQRLLEAPVGEGLFFAGDKHAAIRVVASYAEDQIITTAPEEVARIRMAKKELSEQ